MDAPIHPRQRFSAKISSVLQLSPTVQQFCIEVPNSFVFSPGQSIMLKTSVNDKKISRAYSIASHHIKNGLQLCIKLVEDGKLTPHLFKCTEGMEVGITGPMGTFVVPEDLYEYDICFVATGTGIAPFRAIIHNLLENKNFKSKIILLFGVSYKEELLYRDEWEALIRQYKNRFSFYPCISRLSEPYNGEQLPNFLNGEVYSGRVTKFLEKHITLFMGHHFFICGLGDMVNSVDALCRKNNISESNIHFEKYDK